MNEYLLLSVVQICRQSEEAELVLNLRSELIVSVVFECNQSESSHHMLKDVPTVILAEVRNTPKE